MRRVAWKGPSHMWRTNSTLFEWLRQSPQKSYVQSRVAGVLHCTSRCCSENIDNPSLGSKFFHGRDGGGNGEKPFDERFEGASFLVLFWNEARNNLLNTARTEYRWEAEDVSPVLWLLPEEKAPDVTAAVNGVERSVCDRECVVKLYTGDVITVKKETQGQQASLYFEYICEFFKGLGAGRRCKPVEFERPSTTIITICFHFIFSTSK